MSDSETKANVSLDDQLLAGRQVRRRPGKFSSSS